MVQITSMTFDEDWDLMFREVKQFSSPEQATLYVQDETLRHLDVNRRLHRILRYQKPLKYLTLEVEIV